MARPTTSKHRVSKRKVVEVERRWHEIHIAAGYHEQEFGEPSKAGHALHGNYEGTNGTVTVEHVDDHPEVGGPVFRIFLPRGDSVDVLCANTVRAYLALNEVEGFDAPEIE